MLLILFYCLEVIVFRKAIKVRGKKIVLSPTPWSYNIRKDPPQMRASPSYSFGLKTEVDRGETMILICSTNYFNMPDALTITNLTCCKYD